ncbi:Heat shock protein 75 kDa [Durusdinium trenchii]|uniref:Mitochondrial n=1 Tax=Durusdinium trenchii TaxID=1381693 RepID=A0ABP0JCR5_9DINO
MAAVLTRLFSRNQLGCYRQVPCAALDTLRVPGALTSVTSGFTASKLGPVTQDTRLMHHQGVLKLRCSECRYVVKRWHIPILAVDCNANVRHKQSLSNVPPRSRWSTQVPDYLAPWVEGKQYPRMPHYRQEHTFHCYSRKKHLKLR